MASALEETDSCNRVERYPHQDGSVILAVNHFGSVLI